MTTTISGTAGVTFPAGGVGNPAGAVVGTTDTQTLTNKTLTTPTITQVNSNASLTPTLFYDNSGNQVGTLCRAWVNYKGTSTQSIRASFNVSSVTYNATGNYTINFTNAMTDANYSLVGTTSVTTTGAGGATVVELYDAAAGGTDPTNTAAKIYVHRSAVSAVDQPYVMVSIFR